MIFSMFYQTQRSTLGHLTLDVLNQENIGLPNNVTQYPVEDGGQEISDHITMSSETLQISGSVSSVDAVGIEFGRCTSKLIDAIQMLREMHKNREVIKVVTGLGVYEDMAFSKMDIARSASGDRGGNWLDISANMIKITKIALAQAELPPDKVVAEPAAAGTKGRVDKTEKPTGQSGNASKEPKNENSGRTALHSMFGSKK